MLSRTARRRRLFVVTTAGFLAAGPLAAGPSPASAASAVTISAGTTYQRMDGFGVSEAFGQDNTVRNAPSDTRKQALDMLFSTSGGAGFSILRSIIPAGSDSIEPSSPGAPSATPRYTWNDGNAAQDQGQVWLAKQAKSYGVSNFSNDAWSAPGFMKTDGSDSDGGSLCGTTGATCSSGDWRKAYADYLVQRAKYWASMGLAPSAVGFVNKPSLKTHYSSMLLSRAQAAGFVPTFSAAMKASGLPTKVACCDTLGFSLLPGYVSAVMPQPAIGLSGGSFTASVPARSLVTYRIP